MTPQTIDFPVPDPQFDGKLLLRCRLRPGALDVTRASDDELFALIASSCEGLFRVTDNGRVTALRAGINTGRSLVRLDRSYGARIGVPEISTPIRAAEAVFTVDGSVNWSGVERLARLIVGEDNETQEVA